ncbi:unnamed protein product [Prorocentrum cordatum]|uniref:mRNA guanylyltransferase n=1 Tax=Prorocentrum cordatum TaxID=2364126 RepID=A0ABN9Y698_9DINO|nr:unnamed protein product [Polarella glacialis]
MDKAALGLTLLRGHRERPPLPRERELLRLCNEFAGGQVPDAFPGAQPTSLTRQKADERLLREAYLVCEKTDGERHLLLAHEGHTFLIDRLSRFWLCQLQLPLPSGHPRAPGWHHNTLLDGELVVDQVPGTADRLRYLVYDAVRICDEDVSHRTLLHRLRRALQDVALPKERMMAGGGRRDPVQLLVKDFFEIWQMQDVMGLSKHFPHKVDGLVFTPVQVPYVTGSCPSLFKWKPASLNTVDFKLRLIKGGGQSVHVKLLVGIKKGGDWEIQFCGHWLAKSGELFKELKSNPDAFDGVIGECVWQKEAKTFTPGNNNVYTSDGAWEDGGWVLQRLREDKKLPNDLRTAKRVVESIEDDLSFEALNDKVMAAHREGKLTPASTCGEGGLPRAPVQPMTLQWGKARERPEQRIGRGVCKYYLIFFFNQRHLLPRHQVQVPARGPSGLDGAPLGGRRRGSWRRGPQRSSPRWRQG